MGYDRKMKLTVIMGDIVGSRKSVNPKRLHHSFNLIIEEINREYKSHIKSPLTITLGDEFQGLVTSLTMGFKIAAQARMNLLCQNIESRMVVGHAQIETQVNPKKAWNMMGPGLSEAREILNDKDDFNCYRFSLPSNRELSLLLNGLGRTLTNVETHWTSTQLKYVARVLNSEEPKNTIAKELKISENTLFKVLRSGEFQFYIQQKYTIEEVLALLDKKKELS